MSTNVTAAARSNDMIGKIEVGLETALKEIFATMFGSEARVIPHSEVVDTSRISSVVGFTGRLSGMLGMHFSTEMACNVASGLLGLPLTQPDENVRDAIGELSNMLAGGLKKQLSSTDNMFKISIPTIVSGPEYSMHVPTSARQLWMGIVAGQCRFKIQLVLEQE
jgi:chemotaxis protein CheX